MATFRVKGPNGENFVFRGDFPPTEADIQSFLAGQGVSTVQRERAAEGPSVAQTAIQESFPTNFAPKEEHPGEIGAFLGEITGALATNAIPGRGAFRNLARPIVTGLAAGLGSQAERVVRGKDIDLKQAGFEASLSAVPQAAEEAFLALVRTPLRMTSGGMRLRSNEAAETISKAANRIYRPIEEDQAKPLFDLFQKKTINADLRDVNNYVHNLPGGGIKKRVIRELNALDPQVTSIVVARRDPLGRVNLGAGPTRNLGQISLKQLDEYQSLIGERIFSVESSIGGPRIKIELTEVRDRINDAISRRLDQINLGGADQTAREAWHRLQATKRLNNLITKPPITKFSDSSSDMMEFNVLNLRNTLLGEKTKIIQRINRDLDAIPGARAQFNKEIAELQKILPSGKVSISGISGLRNWGVVAPVNHILSYILTSKPGMFMFKQAIVEGRGTVAFNTLAHIFNVLRRQAMAKETQGQEVQGLANFRLPPAIENMGRRLVNLPPPVPPTPTY